MKKEAFRCPDKQKFTFFVVSRQFSICTNNIAYERECLAFFTFKILVFQVKRQKSYGLLIRMVCSKIPRCP